MTFPRAGVLPPTPGEGLRFLSGGRANSRPLTSVRCCVFSGVGGHSPPAPGKVLGFLWGGGSLPAHARGGSVTFPGWEGKLPPTHFGKVLGFLWGGGHSPPMPGEVLGFLWGGGTLPPTHFGKVLQNVREICRKPGKNGQGVRIFRKTQKLVDSPRNLCYYFSDRD